MPSQERLKRQGQLAEAKQKLTRVEALADTLITSIRMNLDPMADSVTEIPMDKVEADTNQLAEHHETATRLRARIAKLKDLLGE